MSEFEPARLTVRLGALGANYRECVRRSAKAEVAGVVKADGYGLGMEKIAHALAREGCETFFVARLAEGIGLRDIVPRARIFVLDGAEDGTIPGLIANNLTPVLNSLAEIAAWAKAAPGLDAAIHVDTGMNRLGLPAGELSILAAEAKARLKDVHVVLVMSHLACADDPASPMNAAQLARFKAALASLPPAPASLSSSGGVLLGKDYLFDMVRPGIGLYGGNPGIEKPNPFKVVAVLTGRILQLRRVDKGESVGYGATFRTARPSALATVALGYADGLMRAVGNRGAGAIKGVRAPIAGRVSMDLVTLDVTDVPDVSVGGEVEFLGDTISLEELAGASGTVAYEILTSLGKRAARHYEGGA
ncbi:MAG TPA: alanine racemase [Rhizomicrobium sp.]|nr:alanine racemase [Rhizomicrobium sp.]